VAKREMLFVELLDLLKTKGLESALVRIDLIEVCAYFGTRQPAATFRKMPVWHSLFRELSPPQAPSN
jgi:hypothetical protein